MPIYNAKLSKVVIAPRSELMQNNVCVMSLTEDLRVAVEYRSDGVTLMGVTLMI